MGASWICWSACRRLVNAGRYINEYPAKGDVRVADQVADPNLEVVDKGWYPRMLVNVGKE